MPAFVYKPNYCETCCRPPMGNLEAVWSALVMGVRDYTELNGFNGVALGLSGGIDSAVTAMVAADALGPERVLAMAMPAPDTPDEERADAKELSRNIGSTRKTVPVDMPTSETDIPADAAPIPD